MPNFEAKTRAEARNEVVPSPGTKVPQADPNNMAYLGGGGSAFHRVFTYITRNHSMRDVVVPGYFNTCRDLGLKQWDIITCTIGDDPATALEVDLRILHVPTNFRDFITVAKGRQRDFTPVRHGGEALEEAA